MTSTPAISLRFRTKKEYEEIRKAAKRAELSINRYILNVVLSATRLVNSNGNQK
jgi:uncharacterized protein (DUF1778 family)